MKKTKNEQTEATTTESTEPKAPSADPPVDPQPEILPGPAEKTTEGIAQVAYAKVAEELKFKGDFPAWDQVSDRGRALYIEGTSHVQAGGAPRTRFEEVVSKMLAFPNAKG
jgi:hypothetical protein